MPHCKDGMSKYASAKSNVCLADLLRKRVVYDVIVAHNHILHNTDVIYCGCLIEQSLNQVCRFM